MTTLDNSYCVPMTAKEWHEDLLNDRIVPWRLEEIGFKNPLGDTYTLMLSHDWSGVTVTRVIRVIEGNVSVNGEDLNITTFSDLLQFIKFITPEK